MHSFMDNQGRNWTLKISGPAAEKVLDRLKINLFDIEALIDLSQSLSGYGQMVNIAYVLCEAEAEKRSVSPSEFGEALVGDVLEDMTNALLDEVMAFFPAKKKELLTLATKKVRQTTSKLLDAGLAELNAIDVDALVGQILQKSSGSVTK